jgi:ketosteroid isomerase-like protein
LRTLSGRIVRRVGRSNVEVVQRMFDLFAEGGIDPSLEVIDPDVVVEIPPDMSAEPDTYQGHEGVRRYFDGFRGMLEDVTYEPLELTPVGDDHVLAHVRLTGRGASSGLDVGLEPYVVHELSGGRIVRIRPYPDLESARAALG